MYWNWFRSSDLGNITATTWTYQPPSPLVFLLIPKCYKAISFPISSSCKKLFTGTYWQASSIQCLDGAQVVEWTGVDQKEWHEGFSEGEVIGFALLIGWECWERFDAGDFLGSMFADWIYHIYHVLYHVLYRYSFAVVFLIEDLILKWDRKPGKPSSRGRIPPAWVPQPEVLHSIRSCLWKVPVEDPCAMAGQARTLKMPPLWPLQHYGNSMYLHVCSLFSQSHNECICFGGAYFQDDVKYRESAFNAFSSIMGLSNLWSMNHH